MDETLTQHIKIHCPQHHSTFEIAAAPKIVCEILEHELSNDFPDGEFWEYCCDCQIFSPSNLEVGGKAKDACSQCGRTLLRRFVCGQCKIISGDSGEDTKGKIYRVSDANRVEPTCPGCLTAASEVKPHLHKCAETETVIFTTREICPFCKKQIAAPVKVQTPPKVVQIKCVNCKTLNAPDFYFCKECGREIRPNKNITQRGSSTAKSKLLGSLCPTCGADNPTDSAFCANCGQALKAELKQKIPAVPLPPQSAIPTQVLKNTAVGKLKPPPAVKPKSSSAGAGLTASGVILILVVACCVCVNTKSKNDSSSSSGSTNSNTISSYNNNTSSSVYVNSLTLTTSNTIKNSNKTAVNATSNKPASNLSGLALTFNNDYSGTIGRQSFSMSLERNGKDLKGTASTNKTDYVSGWIDNSGNFTLVSYEEEDNNQKTGIYKGRINSDGSINGTWKNPQGKQATSFYLSED